MYKDLTELEPELNVYITGEGEYNAGEMDYFNGTGIPEGWTADVYGLTICVGSKEYTIPASVLSRYTKEGAQLLSHLEQVATDELNEHH